VVPFDWCHKQEAGSAARKQRGPFFSIVYAKDSHEFSSDAGITFTSFASSLHADILYGHLGFTAVFFLPLRLFCPVPRLFQSPQGFHSAVVLQEMARVWISIFFTYDI
jgi:hypothetical protein